MDEKLFNDLEERELKVLEIALFTAAEVTSLRLEEYIQTRLLQGATASVLEKELLTDLKEGGRLFGEFRNAVKATAHGNMRKIADIGTYAYEGISGQMLRWVTVQDNKVCPDCLPRHGNEKTLELWEVEGLPRSGWSVCRNHCRCVLVNTQGQDLPVVIRKRRK